MSWNPYSTGAPAAGQVTTPFPGYPAGSIPPGYPNPTISGRRSPTTDTTTYVYPAGALNHPTPSAPPAGYPSMAGQYISQQAPAYPSGNHTPYPAQPGYPTPYPQQGMYPAVPPATGGYSVGQAPGGYSYSPQDVVGYVFTPTEHEKSKRRIELKFSPAMDKYIRTSEHGQEIIGKFSIFFQWNFLVSLFDLSVDWLIG